MNKVIFVIICILCLPLVYAGSWGPITPSLDPYCSQEFHVMCAENNSVSYNPGTGLIPYSNSPTTRTYQYCVIANISGSIGFAFVDGVSEGISNYTDLKGHDILIQENNASVDYGFGVDEYFDENCNGDELFIRAGDQSLDLSRYTENNKTFDVLDDPSNIDDFDILAEDGSGNLLGYGSYLAGTLIDENSGTPVANVNVTVYFKNERGTLQPYLTYLTDSSGEFRTDSPRDIETNFKTYFDVQLIPKTEYLVVTQHPLYEDLVVELDLHTPISRDFYLSPYGICESDCTFEGSNLCRQECHGINSCAFSSLPNGDWSSVASAMHLQPINTQQYFTINSTYYQAQSCTGAVTEVPPGSGVGSGESSCPPGKSAWKSERLVTKDGEIVKLIVTICQ